jgi:hypothetical protein
MNEIKLLLLGILIGIIIYIIFNSCSKLLEKLTNAFSHSKFSWNSDCGDVSGLLEKIFEKRKITQSNNFDIWIPCSYDNCEEDIIKFEKFNNHKYIGIVEGCDIIASKMALWDILRNQDLMPQSWLLHNKNDMKDFENNYDNKKMYILKNFAQRQEGLKLTRDYNEIINSKDNGFYLIQEYWLNPYIISGRKVNLRYYLIILVKNGVKSAFIFDDGFMYYTPELYDSESMDFNKHVTTGYIDRKVYDENPLTQYDFRKHIGDKSTLWDNNVKTLFNKTAKIFMNKLGENTKLNQHTRFQIFGCDVQPDENLKPKLIEINKGPDLDSKDIRDGAVKTNLLENTLKIVLDEIITPHMIKIY